MNNLKIELTPHDALIIASFLNEFKSDLSGDEKCVTLLLAVNNYQEQVYKMSTHQFEDACAEIEVNSLLGKNPGTR